MASSFHGCLYALIMYDYTKLQGKDQLKSWRKSGYGLGKRKCLVRWTLTIFLSVFCGYIIVLYASYEDPFRADFTKRIYAAAKYKTFLDMKRHYCHQLSKCFYSSRNNKCQHNNWTALFNRELTSRVSTNKVNDCNEAHTNCRKVKKSCRNVEKCVTIVVKTFGRANLVIRMIQSVRSKYPTVSVIVVDDGLFVYRINQKKWNDFKTLNASIYVKYLSMQYDSGASAGRNFGLSYVKTPYFLLVDDDFYIHQNTNIENLLSVLEDTDIDIVGGKLIGSEEFSGLLRVDETQLVVHATKYYSTPVPFHKKCKMCDIVQNFFLAKTMKVRSAGGWSNTLKTFEHEDFFIHMKMSCLKIAYCPEVTAYHAAEPHSWVGYREKRDRAFQMALWYRIKYGVSKYVLCGKTFTSMKCARIAYSFKI